MAGTSGSFTTAQLQTLLTEMQNDPEGLGYSPYLEGWPNSGVNPDVNNLAPILNFQRDGIDGSPTNAVTGPSGAITGATNANPIVVTSAGHGRSVGDSVVISGVLGNTNANGTWLITAVTTNTFTLGGALGVATPAGNGAYTSGGTWAWCITTEANGMAFLSPGATAFQIINAYTKADLAAATPNAAECAWLNTLGAIFANITIVPLTTAAGAENNIIGCCKAFIGNAQTASIANLTALKFRFGSRSEQLLNLPNQANVGQALVARDLQAVFNNPIGYNGL